MDEVRRIAMAVSDPSSAEYGNHLTSTELLELTRPRPADVSAARKWLSVCAVLPTEEGSTDRLLKVRQRLRY